jgi:hypothetical protein
MKRQDTQLRWRTVGLSNNERRRDRVREDDFVPSLPQALRLLDEKENVSRGRAFAATAASRENVQVVNVASARTSRDGCRHSNCMDNTSQLHDNSCACNHHN